MDDARNMTCKFCAEEMKPAAKICPHCGGHRRDIAIHVPDWLGIAIGAVVMLAFIGMLSVPLSALRPGRDFAAYQTQLVLLESTMRFISSTKGDFVIVIGTVSNASSYAWKSLQLEAQFFGPDGRLVDTASRVGVQDELPSCEARGFKIRSEADQPEAAYASHKVFVRWGKEVRAWP